MQLIFYILNFCASILTILGTWEISQKQPNVKRVNLFYLIACGYLIFHFAVVQTNYSMLIMYILLGGFAIRGLINQSHHHR
jgi:hypothetical protein